MSSQLTVFGLRLNAKTVVLSGVCLLLFGVFVCATSFSLLNSYDTKANSLAVDNFQSFYSAADNSVLKFSSDGKFVCRYEEFKYGKIGMIDVGNPMKMMVYYPDFSTVVTLDKFLSPLNTYNFFELGYQNISAVASSTDGRIWFYDNTDFKLKKIDETGKVFLESQQLNVLLEQAPNPNFMKERDNKVYMNDPNLGILVFDLFGSYSKTIPLKGLKRFQVLQDEIVYFENGQINAYNPTTLDVKSLALPDTIDVSLAVLEKNRLGVMRKERIDFYKY